MKRIKYSTGNIYSIDDNLAYSINCALVHYARKHELKPAWILVNPQDLAGYEGELVVISDDNGDSFRAEIVAYAPQPRGRFIVINEATAGIDEVVL